jgi:hypothetical protein
LIHDGPVHEVIEHYVSSIHGFASSALVDRPDRQGTGSARFVGVELEGERGPAMTGDDLTIRLAYRSDRPLLDATVSVSIFGTLGEPLLELSNRLSGDRVDLTATRGEMRCVVQRLPLAPGRYSMSLELGAEGAVVDSVARAAFLEVVAGDFYGTRHDLLDRTPLFFTDHTWTAGSRSEPATSFHTT